MSSVPEWSESAQQIGKSLSDHWAQALQSFGGLASGAGTVLPSLEGIANVPQITFDSGKPFFNSFQSFTSEKVMFCRKLLASSFSFGLYGIIFRFILTHPRYL